jgi:hypothetical protein
VMTAWLAMMVAQVASSTKGMTPRPRVQKVQCGHGAHVVLRSALCFHSDVFYRRPG